MLMYFTPFYYRRSFLGRNVLYKPQLIKVFILSTFQWKILLFSNYLIKILKN